MPVEVSAGFRCALYFTTRREVGCFGSLIPYSTGGSVWVPGNSRGASIFGHGVEPRVAWPMHPRSVVHSVLIHPIFVGEVRA